MMVGPVLTCTVYSGQGFFGDLGIGEKVEAKLVTKLAVVGATRDLDQSAASEADAIPRFGVAEGLDTALVFLPLASSRMSDRA